MQGLWPYILVTKGVTLLAGASIIYYTVRAARRTGDAGLWLLAGGLVLAGAGVLLAGWLPFLVPMEATTSLAITGTLSALGLVIIVFSMATDEGVPR